MTRLTLYRVTGLALAKKFLDDSNIEAITTKNNPGDFSTRAGTTSYWTTSLQSAYAHGRFMNSANKANPIILTVDVPQDLLLGENVVDYGFTTVKWQEASDLFCCSLRVHGSDLLYKANNESQRVNCDRKLLSDDQVPRRVRQARRKQITIGPESAAPTWKYMQHNHPLRLSQMKVVRNRNGTFARQYAFADDARRILLEQVDRTNPQRHLLEVPEEVRAGWN